MKQLFVEELESRNLLSVTGFDHILHHAPDNGRGDPEPIAHSSGRSFGDSGFPVRYQTDVPAHLNFTSAEPGGSSARLAPAIRYQTELPLRPNTSGSERGGDLVSSFTAISVETVEVIVVGSPDLDVSELLEGPSLSGSTLRQSIAAAPSPGPISTIPLSFQIALAVSQRAPAGDLTEVAALAAAETGNAVSAGSTEAVASALSSKASTPVAARADSLGAGAFRNVGATLFNSNSAARTGTDAGVAGDSPLERIPSIPPAPPAPARELPQSPLAQSIRGGLANLPQFADLMTGMSTLNLDRIEQGMANFVTSLESASSPSAAANQRDLYPWMLAALVTALACELTRRQLNKSVAPDGLDLATLPIPPWELPRESENGCTSR